jgi:hypothetical protein
MDRLGRLSVAGLLLAGAVGAVAAADPVAWDCPSRVTAATGAAPADSPPGWTLQATGQPQLLTGLMVFDGPPEQGAALKSDEVSADGRRLVWSLRSLAAEPAWLSCEYGSGAVRLVRSLPPDLRWCEAKVTRRGRPPVLGISVRCGNTERIGG